MKIFEVEEKAKPLYIYVEFDEKTKNQIMDFVDKQDFEKPITKDDIHCTLIYSKKPVFGYTEPKKVKYTGEFDKFKFLGEKEDCLVILLDSEDLENRQKELMEELNASFDYDEYQPHVTIAYEISNFDLSMKPKFDTFVANTEKSKEIKPKKD